MQSRALSGYGPCSHGAHGPDLGEVLSLSKMLAQETAAESATFPKISKSSARNQRKKVVENCELRGLENLYSSTAHFGSGGYGRMEALDLEALLVIGLQGFRRFQKPRTLQCNTTDYQMAL